MFDRDRNGMLRPQKHKHSKKPDARPSRQEPVVARFLAEKLQLPEDVLSNVPIITAYGNYRFCVENYRNIIEYTDELIRIQTRTGRIHVRGKGLVIAYFRDDAMCVVGNISCVEYH